MTKQKKDLEKCFLILKKSDSEFNPEEFNDFIDQSLKKICIEICRDEFDNLVKTQNNTDSIEDHISDDGFCS